MHLLLSSKGLFLFSLSFGLAKLPRGKKERDPRDQGQTGPRKTHRALAGSPVSTARWLNGEPGRAGPTGLVSADAGGRTANGAAQGPRSRRGLGSLGPGQAKRGSAPRRPGPLPSSPRGAGEERRASLECDNVPYLLGFSSTS